MSLRWIPAIASVPPRSSASKRRQHQVADGREQDCGVELYRWRVGGALCGRGAQLARQLLGRDATCHHVHFGALSQRDLRGDMCAAAEPVEPEPAAGRKRCALQRPVADDAGA